LQAPPADLSAHRRLWALRPHRAQLHLGAHRQGAPARPQRLAIPSRSIETKEPASSRTPALVLGSWRLLHSSLVAALAPVSAAVVAAVTSFGNVAADAQNSAACAVPA